MSVPRHGWHRQRGDDMLHSCEHRRTRRCNASAPSVATHLFHARRCGYLVMATTVRTPRFRAASHSTATVEVQIGSPLVAPGASGTQTHRVALTTMLDGLCLHANQSLCPRSVQRRGVAAQLLRQKASADLPLAAPSGFQSSRPQCQLLARPLKQERLLF